MNFQQPTGQSTVEYLQAPGTEALRCRLVYNKYHLKGTNIEGLRESIRRSTLSFWAKNKLASLQELAHNAQSLADLKSARQPQNQDNKEQNRKKRATVMLAISSMSNALQAL